MTPFSPQELVPAGKVLLTGAFAATLVHALRGKQDLTTVFERLVVGFVCLTFFQGAAAQLDDLSGTLTIQLDRMGDYDLKAFLLKSAVSASAQPSALGGLNDTSVLQQAWRVGVWGIMASLVEGFFLIVAFVLECARDVLWKLLWFVFPLGCGVSPLFPRLLQNLCVYAVELTLWFPALVFIQKVTGVVVRDRVNQNGSLGLYIVGVEIIAIFLILMVPKLVHSVVHGALSSDLNTHSGMMVWLNQSFRRGKHIRITEPPVRPRSSA